MFILALKLDWYENKQHKIELIDYLIMSCLSRSLLLGFRIATACLRRFYVRINFDMMPDSITQYLTI